jgi:hypothetical protein
MTPINMVLHCPACGVQHIDAPELTDGTQPTWGNPPHRSHLCNRCGHIWRPADVATNGVIAITTKGERDSLTVHPVRRKLSEDDLWKNAVIDACVVNHISWDDSDPRKTLANLISWEKNMALDPQVSDEARQLVLDGAAAARRRGGPL